MNIYVKPVLLLVLWLIFSYLLFNENNEKVNSINFLPKIHESRFALKDLNQLKDCKRLKGSQKFKDLHELKALHDLIAKQISKLQEEGDCEKKKVLICRNVENYAGFGSNVHRYGVCMQVAYGLGRMFFIEQDEYSHFNGVFQWLKPESERCGYLKKKYFNNYSKICNIQNPACYLSNGYDVNNSHHVLEFNAMGRYPYPRHVPGTIPKSLESKLLSLGVKYPWMWFTSQFLGYLLLRPTHRFKKTLKTLRKTIFYRSPIVGFHVRHGDKLMSGEAKYVSEAVYLNEAQAYFNSINASRKCIYVATDDIQVIQIIKKLSPNILISTLSTESLSKNLGSYFSIRFPKEIIESVLVDLYFLANTDYLVCDFSSNLCRLAYELKQSLPPFKQENILKSVGESQPPSYIWWYHSYPRSLWVTVTTHPFKEILNTNESSLNIIDYNIELFILKENVPNWKTNSFVLVQRLHEKGSNDVGYVYSKDLMAWPGSPPYFYT